MSRPHCEYIYTCTCSHAHDCNTATSSLVPRPHTRLQGSRHTRQGYKALDKRYGPHKHWYWRKIVQVALVQRQRAMAAMNLTVTTCILQQVTLRLRIVMQKAKGHVPPRSISVDRPSISHYTSPHGRKPMILLHDRVQKSISSVMSVIKTCR